MDGVVDGFQGLHLAAERVAGDVDAIVPEVGIKLCDVLHVGVGLPFGVGLACLEGGGRGANRPAIQK